MESEMRCSPAWRRWPDERPGPGEECLVCLPRGREGQMMFAVRLEAGAQVTAGNGALLQVPEDGFWLRRQEEDGAVRLIRLPDGEGIFWSPAPLPPEGLADGPVSWEISDALHCWRRQQDALLRREILASRNARRAWQNLGAPDPGGEPAELQAEGCVYRVPAREAARALLGADALTEHLRGCGPEVPVRLSRRAALCRTEEDLEEVCLGFLGRQVLDAGALPFLEALCAGAAGLEEDFFRARRRILEGEDAPGKSTAQILQQALSSSRLPGLVRECLEHPGPESLQACLAAWAGVRGRGLLAVTDRFSGLFGVTEDGLRGERALYGDLELMPPGRPAGAGTAMPRFQCAELPNFLMRRSGRAVWDAETRRYVRDGRGEIRRFPDAQTAVEAAAAMNADGEPDSAGFSDS